VARKSALESELSTTLRAFYCALCDKQFKTVAQYDEHTNSYAHHHKARFKDMQANVRLKPKEDMDKRKEKERKREEKELRKIAAANGIRMAKPTPALNLDAATRTDVPMDVSSTTVGLESQPAAKKSGWASLTPASSPALPTIPSEDRVSPPSTNNTSNAPAFRTAGWTSLDTGSSHAFPPPPTPPIPPPPPPTSTPPPEENWSTGDTKPVKGGWAAVSGSFPPLAPSGATPPISNPQPVRSSWQQFQKSAPRKR
jgi:Zinc-finger double-stranded RNA-binding